MKVRVKIDMQYLPTIYKNMLHWQSKYYGLPCGQLSGCGMRMNEQQVYLGDTFDAALIAATELEEKECPHFPLSWKRSSGTTMVVHMNGTIDLTGARNSVNELWNMFIPTGFCFAELVGDYETSKPEWKFWETSSDHVPELVREIMGNGSRIDGRKQVKLIRLLRNIDRHEDNGRPNWWYMAAHAAEEARILEQDPHDLDALRSFKKFVLALRDEI